MARYLTKIAISNLRNIKMIKEIDFITERLVIFDGPNGYGKSTVFDAIELLLTGRLNHFYEKTYNRGVESLKTIANDDTKPTIITGTFTDGENKFEISRIIEWGNNIKNIIQYKKDNTEEIISEEYLNNILHIDQNIFDIGMYISQSDSLNFLQRKYKDRKNTFTSIIKTSEIEEKDEILKKISNKLNNNIQIKKEAIEKEINAEKQNQQKIESKISKITTHSSELTYSRLVVAKEFDFDKKNIDINIPFLVYEKKLSDIKKYIDAGDDYLNIIYNNSIDKLFEITDNQFKACYYREWISYFNTKHSKYKDLIELQEIRRNLTSKKGLFINPFFQETHSDIYEIYKDKLRDIEILKERMSTRDRKISQLVNQRKSLSEEHKNNGILDQEQCPYCGVEHKNLDEAFEALSDKLEKLQENDSTELKKAQTKLESFIYDLLLPEIDKLLNSEMLNIGNYKKVQSQFQEDISTLLTVGEKFGIDTFIYNKQDKVDFSDAFKNFKFKVENQKKSVSKNLSKEEMQVLNRVHKEIYTENKLNITTYDIERKLEYIKNQYDNDLFSQKKISENKIKNMESIFNAFVKKSDRMASELDELRDKRKKALNKYQSNFIAEIKIALYVISGRIIQTFPLGIGINMETNENQLLFRVENKQEDIFNVLSTGQLNGLIISILLAVRKTFFDADALDVILIDDPLQSIDDLSAHSFVDLLGEEFSESQVFLSTHEVDKSSLFSYKYRQLRIAYKRVNMQDEFLKKNTE
ncbi:AAA family ATPase [Listeria booriae]|uniref:Nuclease SbcCD subunit C n=3 Tax=Listeria booriae TaxID=1552123 RepID=A0A842CUP6_9LIST|nr:AAA family ATPase [Listeria booriae]MBC2005485.1 AAA family ATPase [Listeria booriae]